MPTVVQFRRGTTAQNNAFTGVVGEISVDTDKDTLRVHDGSTEGGSEILSANATQTITNKTPNQSWIPATDSAYDLGSVTYQWKDLYLSGTLLGNASTATTLQTARTIAISGDVTGSATSFNGSANITISAGITAGSILSADFNSATSLIIYDSAGTVLKTIYSPGS